MGQAVSSIFSATTPSSSSLLFQRVRVFDGEHDIPNGYVLVQDGKIKRVSEQPIDPPQSATVVIDKPGHTLLPGLIDAHVHVYEAAGLTQSLQFGVTTVCDMHNEPDTMAKMRAVAAEDTDAADLRAACHGATIEGGWPAALLQSHDPSPEFKAAVDKWPKLETQTDVDAFIKQRKSDADFIKLFHEDGHCLKASLPKPSVELQRMVINAAHKNGLRAFAHAFGLQSAIDVLNAGADGTAHTIVDYPPTQELIDAYKRNNAHCNPTLVGIASMTAEGLRDQVDYANDPRVQRFLPGPAKALMCKCVALASDSCRVEYAYESVRMMRKAGVDVVMGTDTTGRVNGMAYGATAHHEIGMFVKHCGFTPIEALRSATSVTARRFQLDDRGRIQPGLRADLVLVEGNPMENIRDTLNLRGVWKKGILCSSYKI
ncbi:hypothetical protein QQS21_004542 [Conoideocrella luteorostrata]|uniref:Amidohydrolase-related domain-containing protein n=1 Tax=Conoideocrella luteorostrata TaxID=1105319 RepID=A0AAJ0CR74_9HYPO|nr:hypothetical protein QQS21_004542 [Conoideocrella luteorostrata]